MIDELYTAINNADKGNPFVVTCDPNTIFRRINQICKKNGLPKVGIHGLRHSIVSLAYHLGISEKIVMDLGGWADYQTMRKIYTHIAKSDVADSAEKFRDFFKAGA